MTGNQYWNMYLIIGLIFILIGIIYYPIVTNELYKIKSTEPFNFAIDPHTKKLNPIVKFSFSTELTLITSSGFKTIPGLNLVYFNDNLYLTNQPEYIFTGILDKSKGMYRLTNTLGTQELILKFNSSNASHSKIIQSYPSDIQTNNNNFTIQNIFNQTDTRIYLDPVNNVISSNDNSGNRVYLTFLFVNSPAYWNYSIENATQFNIKYIG